MNAVMTGPDLPASAVRCKIDEVFTRPFIELIGLAPRNPVVRGLILAQTGKMPGPERGTFEQIREWVETTCDKKLRPANAPRSQAGDGISVTVEFSETEYGRAGYSVNRYGSEEVAFDADELLEMVRDAIADGDGLESVVDKIAGEIHDHAWDRCEPVLEDFGEYEYDNHDATDSANSSVEFPKNQVRDRLVAFLRNQHPNLLEELT